MVTLNITLLIELGLFLIFLWGTAVFIIRPAVQALDERGESIERDAAEAETANQEAETLESRYRSNLADIRLASDEAYRDARRETLQGHIKAVADAHQWADEAVAEARAEAQAKADEQRGPLEHAVPDLADQIAERLRERGPFA